MQLRLGFGALVSLGHSDLEHMAQSEALRLLL